MLGSICKWIVGILRRRPRRSRGPFGWQTGERLVPLLTIDRNAQRGQRGVALGCRDELGPRSSSAVVGLLRGRVDRGRNEHEAVFGRRTGCGRTVQRRRVRPRGTLAVENPPLTTLLLSNREARGRGRAGQRRRPTERGRPGRLGLGLRCGGDVGAVPHVSESLEQRLGPLDARSSRCQVAAVAPDRMVVVGWEGREKSKGFVSLARRREGSEGHSLDKTSSPGSSAYVSVNACLPVVDWLLPLRGGSAGTG